MNWLIVGLLLFLPLGCATQNIPGVASYEAVPSAQILGFVQAAGKSEETGAKKRFQELFISPSGGSASLLGHSCE